jgi:hypothetical protein
MIDLRLTRDEQHTMRTGVLYRKGGTIQVWWTEDVLGRPFTGTEGRETIR